MSVASHMPDSKTEKIKIGHFSFAVSSFCTIAALLYIKTTNNNTSKLVKHTPNTQFYQK